MQVGTYRLRGRLGAGGMGRVYLGSSAGGRAVAVKVVHPELARDPEFMRRFHREVDAARKVNSAFTAAVIEAGPDDDPPWLATVFVDGPSLAELAAKMGPLPEVDAWRLAGGLAEALQAVHVCGLVHRDLKPGNILIARDGPRVIDFGIARGLQDTAMTAVGTTIGTPAFMSPEQARGEEAGPASDIFSFGSVLAFATTGAAPFDGGEALAIRYKVANAEPDLTRVPPGLRALVAACLAKDPAARPSPAQLLAAITFPPADVPGRFWPGPVGAFVEAWRHGVGMPSALPATRTARPGAMPGRPGPLPQPVAARGPSSPHRWAWWPSPSYQLVEVEIKNGRLRTGDTAYPLQSSTQAWTERLKKNTPSPARYAARCVVGWALATIMLVVAWRDSQAVLGDTYSTDLKLFLIALIPLGLLLEAAKFTKLTRESRKIYSQLWIEAAGTASAKFTCDDRYAVDQIIDAITRAKDGRQVEFKTVVRNYNPNS